MKKLEYIPIYKGEYNMTPDEYIKEVEEVAYKKSLMRDIITSVEWSIFALCAVHITLSIIM